MNSLAAAALVLCALVPSVLSASNTIAWCYHDPSCNDTNWPVISPRFCNGSKQSPINIVTADATADANLTAFTFTNYDNVSVMDEIKNTGKTVRVSFRSGSSVSGGNLPEAYDGLQFHLHWGNGSSVPGSEHTVNGKRYPMELHIVNIKSSLNGNITQALADPTGLAALGFFIEVMPDATAQPESWKNLTNYLTSISNKDEAVSLVPAFSLDDLLHGVDRTKYYRYYGSLTTPTCDEVIIWTVFKEPIKVSKDLIDLFSTTLRISNSSSPLMTNVYRNVQPTLAVTTQASSASKTCYSLGLLAMSIFLARH
ncbi:carbonic anhydrase XVb [Echeneis naucrates]|uniref:Carbonic anhydrase n=1 Tax=Echeneis naucrates TaxID=173247 RepID=A0A665UNJ0_ECHNA|nr:carbonic anhydrase 4-like [Echeneis naucrates]